MKQLTSKLWAKITALILVSLVVSLMVLSAAGIAYVADSGGYIRAPEAVLDDALQSGSFWRYMNTAQDYYTCVLRAKKENYSDDFSYYEGYFSPKNSNFYFTVTDTSGKPLFESPGAEDGYRCKHSVEYSITYNWRNQTENRIFQNDAALEEYLDSLAAKQYQDIGIGTEELEDGRIKAEINYTTFDFDTVIITGFVRQTFTAQDSIYAEQFCLGTLLNLRYWLIALAVILLLLALALLVFLLCAAGHKEGVEGIHLNWVDRIPLDLYLAAMFFLIACVVFALGDWSNSSSWIMSAILFVLALSVCIPLIMGVLMTIATRFKSGSWWRNTAIFYCCRLILRFCRWLVRGLRQFVHALPLIWQSMLLWAAYTLVEFILLIGAASAYDPVGWIVLWLLLTLALTVGVVMLSVHLRKIQAGGRALAEGNLDYVIDTKNMHLALREHTENLNSIANGMQKAVASQMRSERFRTELITNVSHDIKTPLTSIVNYVDLLKKEDVQPEKAREYVAVLDRQSARLKKLTEDLVEASKASTGSIAVSLEPTDVNVLLGQVAGEYLDRLEAAGLEPVFKPDPSAPKIMADGKLLWRVLDNLLSNICKYAMPGTRMYFSSEAAGGQVIITFRNISKYALDISADELMERFVRGDASRSTEGSGLGLSIAQSLTQLQKGAFALQIDGDLFKAMLTFDELK